MIEEITDNAELAAVFAAQWGDHGGRPSKASFAMHALISASYLESGSWYPIGGGAAFTAHIIPTITANGGDARAGVKVEALEFDGKTDVIWSTVERWARLASGKRGEDYRQFKTKIEDTMFAQFEKYFPGLAKLVVFRELSTPLATTAITGHHQGAFYGLDVTPKRVMSDALRAATPIDGLYLTGQDVASPGIPGALWGGMLAAASVDSKVFKQFRG